MADASIIVTGEVLPKPETEDDKAKAAHDEAVREFLAIARERFQTIVSAETQLRKDMMDDLEFRASDQWDTKTKAIREQEDRPCLVINRLPQFIRQVTNAQRSSNLAVKVTGVDDQADVKTAEVIQGLIRHIEQQSDASVAYSTAGEHQATMGRGYWRVVTEYDGDRSFVQNIRIKRVRNPFSVFVDPSAQEADGSDARYAFIVEDVPRREFKTRYGEAAMTSLEQFEATAEGKKSTDWMPEGKVKIAEYWHVESTREDIVLVRWADGGDDQALTKAEYDAIDDETREKGKPEVIANRTAEVRKVKQAVISGSAILEGNLDKTAGADWPGQWIPIVPCLGDEIDINGQLDLRGMVRDAKDPQRLYNYQNSTLAETLATVPRAPWVGYEGQFEGHEEKWGTANRVAYPYLEVKPTSIDNIHALPLPQRVSQAADIGSIMVAIQQSDQDLKATMGLYEPSLGVRQSSGQSGKAIEALKKQGEQANSNFLDNMSRSIRFTGRLIVDLIPKIYDAKRVVRIIGTDDTEKAVMVHSGAANAPSPDMEMQKGVDGVYDVGVGRFDVAVSAKPSLETRRAEALEALSSLMTAYPAAFPLLGDLLVGSLDWPGAKAAASRLKRAVPPEVLEGENEGDENSIPPEVAAKMQALMQQLEQTGMALQEAQQVIQTKKLELDAKAEAEREKGAAAMAIAQFKAEADKARAAMEIELQMKADAFLAKLEAQLDSVTRRLEHAHERGMEAQRYADDRRASFEDRDQNRVEETVNRNRDREDTDRTRSADREDAATEATRAEGRPVPKDLTKA